MRYIFIIVFIAGCYLGVAQINTEKIDRLIPQLQYDQDFMTFAQLNMIDGFQVIKSLNVKKKFFEGRRVYAIEKVLYSGKAVRRKLTYFYLDTTPIAISDEQQGFTYVYYLRDTSIIAVKKFRQADYKPYGGGKKLDLGQILPAGQKQLTVTGKQIAEAKILLEKLKAVTKDLLNYPI